MPDKDNPHLYRNNAFPGVEQKEIPISQEDRDKLSLIQALVNSPTWEAVKQNIQNTVNMYACDVPLKPEDAIRYNTYCLMKDTAFKICLSIEQTAQMAAVIQNKE